MRRALLAALLLLGAVSAATPQEGFPVGPLPTATGQATTGQIPGTATNDDAAAGKVGEYVSSEVQFGSAISLTTNTAANITSISLTAGDWDVWAYGGLNGGATTNLSYVQGAVSTTSAAIEGLGTKSNLYVNGTPFGVLTLEFDAGKRRISLSATTTIYLVLKAGFTVSTCTGYGGIYARRVR